MPSSLSERIEHIVVLMLENRAFTSRRFSSRWWEGQVALRNAAIAPGGKVGATAAVTT